MTILILPYRFGSSLLRKLSTQIASSAASHSAEDFAGSPTRRACTNRYPSRNRARKSSMSSPGAWAMDCKFASACARRTALCSSESPPDRHGSRKLQSALRLWLHRIAPAFGSRSILACSPASQADRMSEASFLAEVSLSFRLATYSPRSALWSSHAALSAVSAGAVGGTRGASAMPNTTAAASGVLALAWALIACLAANHASAPIPKESFGILFSILLKPTQL